MNDGKNVFLINLLKMICEHLIILEKLELVKDMSNSFLLDYPYFKKHYKRIAIDLSKQQGLDADPKVMWQNNFTGNLDRDENPTIYFIIEESKETILDFLETNERELQHYFALL